MKTRRNGKALAIYCGATGCETAYADVFADRVLVYSFHYGRTHSTPIDRDQFIEIVNYMAQGESASVQCVCNQTICAEVTPQGVTLNSKHWVALTEGKTRISHRNFWGPEEVEIIAETMGLAYVTMPPVEIDITGEVRQAS